jgi:glyoxylase I family protein
VEDPAVVRQLFPFLFFLCIMKIEHVAFQVADPAAMADWYVEHLHFSVCRSSDQPVVARFIADASGGVMLEIYRNPSVPVPDYGSVDPAVMHVAFVCSDLPATVARLTDAGAALIRGPEVLDGDELAMLRDPWGLAIQLAKRKSPMVG